MEKTGKNIKTMKEFIDVNGNKWLISGENIPEGLLPIKPKQNMIEKLTNHKKPSKMKGKHRKYPQRLINAKCSGYMLKPKFYRRKNGKRK